tara:strand:+ start:463 stop:675 length:213 start_codon:yes stop_codon:yes gene_type:complete
MKLIEAYQASDGALFPTSNQCQEHETSLQWRAKISEFMESDLCAYKRGAGYGMVNKIVVAWEQFKIQAQQ